MRCVSLGTQFPSCLRTVLLAWIVVENAKFVASAQSQLFDFEARGFRESARGNEALGEQIVRDGLKTVPRDAPPTEEVASLRCTLAAMLMYQKRYDESAAEFDSAIKTAIAASGNDSAIHLRVLSQLAMLREYQEKVNESETILLHVLAVQERSPKGLHREVVATLERLARLWSRAASYEKAEQYLRRAIAITDRKLHSSDSESSRLTVMLAETLCEQKQFRASEALLRQYLQRPPVKKRLDVQDSDIDVIVQIGRQYEFHERRFDDAEIAYRQVLQSLGDEIGSGDQRAFECRLSLARVLKKQHKLSQAQLQVEELLRTATRANLNERRIPCD